MQNILDELSWRGLIQDKVTGLENILRKKTTVYIGFDPTYDSLHIGSLIPIIVSIHLQNIGHKQIVIIGEATGFIGDPSEKKNERIFLKKDILQKYVISIKNQIFNLFSYHSKKIELLNNLDWIKNITFIEFIREIGKHFTVNYLISKDSVKNRIKNKKKGLSFTELSYSIIQGYDYLHLNRTKNCQLQIGGSDQWGNIITGIELIKKITGKKVYGFTCPLITSPNGLKFGKSEELENIWLDRNKTSPYKLYQFWINISDNDAEKYIKMYTFLSKEKIENLIVEHRYNPSKRLLQKKLANVITKWIHGDKELKKITKITSILFDNNNKILQSLNEDIMTSIYENIPHILFSKKELNYGIFLIDILKNSRFLKSKKKANYAIKNNSIYVNKIIIKKNFLLVKKDLIKDKYILFQFGKKEFFIIKFI
ncbi:tyrosine--tRNA ligase [Blattabacterium cuenoti]|uniref:tyrosine--tRNA ligase n=1 Tax=Blattabacterium cuenoti TaxID=1653831 RepID=UPI00163D2456|nr:tyrosine--tRNA ligase [Blattabacterium cuenoti]